MAARKSTRVNRKYKTKYRVTNWREYERGLKSRGDITVWFSQEAREAWTPPRNGRRGGQPRYSNLAIVTALTLRMVFHLPLRQTEGITRLVGAVDGARPESAGPHHAVASEQRRRRACTHEGS